MCTTLSREVAAAKTSAEKRLGAEITELCAHIHAATARLLARIAEFDGKRCWEPQGFCSCAHWLNFNCGIGLNAAREKVRVARALTGLPAISAAFRAGKLSYSKLRAMTRIADAENEDYLLRIAEHGTAYHVERLVSQYRRCRRQQDARLANAQFANRELNYYYDDDGSLVIQGLLPAEQAALVVKALELARADVSAETSPQRDAGISHIEDGPQVSAETSRRLACDCSIVRLVEDDAGQPLSIGRKSRSIPPAIRRALRYRDRGCRFPGCTHRHFVDGHHVRHWADGGETSLDNLVQLCRHHHRLVHEGGFECRREADGGLIFVGQHGDRLPVSVPVSQSSEPEFERWLRRQSDETGIDQQTGIPRIRAGERIDWNLAVSHLFN